MARGSFGRIRNLQDFCGSFEDVTWASTSVDLGEGLYLISVNEGTLNKTLTTGTAIDEPNGILEFLTDTGDNDNATLLSGPFRPVDGPMHVETRFKIVDDLVAAIYTGFAETMSQATPVMPAEFATATMTYNPGGQVGINYDDDGTVDDFRACMGDGSAAVASSGNGTRLSRGTWAIDQYALTKVILGPDGSGHCFAAIQNARELGASIADYSQGLTTTDLFYAVLMCENRDASAHEFPVRSEERRVGKE